MFSILSSGRACSGRAFRRTITIALASAAFCLASLGLLVVPAAAAGTGFGGDPALDLVDSAAGWRLVDVHDPNIVGTTSDPPTMAVFPARDVDALENAGHLPPAEAAEIRAELAAEGIDYTTSDEIFVVHLEAAWEKAAQTSVLAGGTSLDGSVSDPGLEDPGHGQARAGEKDCWGWQAPATKNKSFDWSDPGTVRRHSVDESVFNGSIEAKIPLSLTAEATVTYKLKKAFCTPYKFRLVETKVVGDAVITDGYVEADATLSYSNEWKWKKRLYEIDLGRITFSVGPVPVHLNFALPLDIGIDASIEVQGTAKVRGDLSSANAHFDVVCDESNCNGNSSYDYDFDIPEPELSATINAKTKLWAQAGVRVDVYQEDVARAQVSAQGFASAHLFGYVGNTCGDADGDGSNEWITSLLLDGDVGYSVDAEIGGAFFPDRDWNLLGSTYHLFLWDLLGAGESRVLEPMISGPSTAEVGESVQFEFRTRPCYPYSENVTLQWRGGVSGGGTVTPPDGKHVHSQLVTRGEWTVRAYPYSDTHGRYLQDYDTRRTLSVDYPPFDQPHANDKFGREAATGDFNCDGLADVAISAPDEEMEGRAKVGLVTVIFADHDNQGLPAMDTGQIKHLSEPRPFTSSVPKAYTYFGSSTAVGDFDGNGCDDLAVGAPGHDTSEGMVKIFYGHEDTGLALEQASWLYLGSFGLGPYPPARYDNFGDDLAAGDLNGDGYDDLAIAIPGRDNGGWGLHYGKGQAVVVYGGYFYKNFDRCRYQSVIDGPFLDNQCAFLHLRQGEGGMPDVAENGDGRYMQVAIGNFDGDAYDDLVITYPEESGTYANDGLAFVLRGDRDGLDGHGPGSAGTLDVTQLDQRTIRGGGTSAEAEDYAFSAVATGDFDGDGYDDLALGSENENWGSEVDAGVVQVVPGSGQGLDFQNGAYLQINHWDSGWGVWEQNRFGSTLAAGDFDGDGRDDLAIGAPGLSGFDDGGAGYMTEAGGVLVAYGLPGLEFETRGPYTSSTGYYFSRVGQLFGPRHSSTRIGSCLAAGDFDGDGIDDLVIGSDGTRVEGQSNAGSANVLYGSAGNLQTGGQVYLIQN